MVRVETTLLALSALVLSGASGAADAPKARFGIMADIHIKTNAEHRVEMLRQALRLFDAWQVDGVMAAGDLTQNGQIAELRTFAETWYEVFPHDRRSDGEHVEKLFVYGDHDTETTSIPYFRDYRRQHGKWPSEFDVSADIVLNDRAAQWKAAFHEDFAPIVHKRVKGIDFVLAHLVNLDEDGMRYADPLHIPGLEAFFATNAFDRTQPFFYVQHKLPRGTVGGPTQTGQDSGRTSAILRRHPNAVAVCGHKHRSAVEELSLWQGDFTALQTPALTKLLTAAGRENGVCSCDAPVSVPAQQMAPLDTEPDGSHVMVVSVFEDRLVVERIDVFHSGEAVAEPWTIPWPNTGAASFEVRGRDRVAPQFAPDARIRVACAHGLDRARKEVDQIVVRFPPAHATPLTPRAYDYEVSAVLSKGLVTRTVMAKRVYSPKCYWPERYDTNDVVCVFGRHEIPADHDAVTFIVRPLDAWGHPGASISSAPASYWPVHPLYPF